VKKVYSFEVPLFFGGIPAKVVCDQIRTVDKSRFLKKLGTISSVDMAKIGNKLAKVLNLKTKNYE
jgi:mRNA-degrading endonuclease toxin of MazEF toxin-antitoxin module